MSGQNSESTRNVEREILLKVTGAMEEASSRGDNDALRKAITDNQLLWTVFVRDLESETNQLPQDLRRQLIEIGHTVIREITDNINGTPDLDFLININKAIIDGLSEQAA
jgi:flagellar protein FlaF